MAMRPTLRLYVLGQLSAQAQPQTLITLAEFKAGRAVERVQLDRSKVDELTAGIRALRGFIEAGYPPFEEPSLKQLGGELFDLVIRQDVRRLFDQATGQIAGFLPLEIFVEEYGIAGWPWEYLYDSATKTFICQEFHPISRGIFTLDPRGSLTAKKGKVRILLVIGVSPDDSGTTPKEEIKLIHEVFAAYLATGNIEMKIMEAVGPVELERELQASRYDILHFFGHAGFDVARKEGYLKFERANAQPFHFYANAFGRLLAEQGIRLAFLNACETAKAAQNEDPGRSSVAAALLTRGIPAVIATQFSMPDTSAHFFASLIYNALATGKPLIDALRDGRRAMSYAQNPQFFDWGIPVLYSSDPDLIVFPRPTKQRQPKWVAGFEYAVNAPDVIQSLMGQTALRGPSIAVERTTRSPHKDSAKVRVALIDIDSKVGFLPDIVAAANQAQQYYDFQVVYLPIPSGAVRTDLDEGRASPQMFLPRLEGYLSGTPQNLHVHLVCCLTRHPIAGDVDGALFWDHFSAPLNSNEKVSIVSTFGLREYARQANVSFAKATLYLCLAMIIVTEDRWPVEFHGETVGCLFDYCEQRADLVLGLRRMRFDHAGCREKIQDPLQLAAIEALVALEVHTDEPAP